MFFRLPSKKTAEKLDGFYIFAIYMKEYGYTVAGHGFVVEADGGIELGESLAHYAPFASATEPQTVPAAATMTAPAPVLN